MILTSKDLPGLPASDAAYEVDGRIVIVRTERAAAPEGFIAFTLTSWECAPDGARLRIEGEAVENAAATVSIVRASAADTPELIARSIAESSEKAVQRALNQTVVQRSLARMGATSATAEGLAEKAKALSPEQRAELRKLLDAEDEK